MTDCEKFDIKTQEWKPCSPLTKQRAKFGIGYTTLAKEIMAIGGIHNVQNIYISLKNVGL